MAAGPPSVLTTLTLRNSRGGDVIDPRAPVCWLANHSSVSTIFARPSCPFSIRWRIIILFAVLAVCQFMRPSPCRSLGDPDKSRGSVDATWAAWEATFLDFPIRSVILASEMVVNFRQQSAYFRTAAFETRGTSVNSVLPWVAMHLMHAMPGSTRFLTWPSCFLQSPRMLA